MSYNPSLAKESYEEGRKIQVYRPKTGKMIKVAIYTEDYQPIEIISRIPLKDGEVLMWKEGKNLAIFGNFTTTGPGMDTWNFIPYEAQVVVTKPEFILDEKILTKLRF